MSRNKVVSSVRDTRVMAVIVWKRCAENRDVLRFYRDVLRFYRAIPRYRRISGFNKLIRPYVLYEFAVTCFFKLIKTTAFHNRWLIAFRAVLVRSSPEDCVVLIAYCCKIIQRNFARSFTDKSLFSKCHLIQLGKCTVTRPDDCAVCTEHYKHRTTFLLRYGFISFCWILMT